MAMYDCQKLRSLSCAHLRSRPAENQGVGPVNFPGKICPSYLEPTAFQSATEKEAFVRPPEVSLR